MGPEQKEKNKFYLLGADGVAVPLGNITDISFDGEANPFGDTYSLLSALTNAFDDLELTAHLTAKEIRNLQKLMGVKRKVAADLRKQGEWKRYHLRKAEKIRKKVEYGRLRKR